MRKKQYKLIYYSTAYYATHGGSLQSINFAAHARESDILSGFHIYPDAPLQTTHKVNNSLRDKLKKIPLMQVLFFFRRNKIRYEGLVARVKEQQADAVLIQTDSTFLQVSRLKKEFPNLLVTTIVNASPFDEPFKNIAFKSYFRRLERKSLQKADLNFFVSENLRQRIMGGEQEEKNQVIFNGVDIDKFFPIAEKDQLKAKHGYSTDAFYLGYVGTIDVHKHLDVLVKAFATLNRKFSNMKLCIIGDGSGMQTLKDQVARFDLKEAVEVRGWVDHSQINEHLNCFDLAVHHIAFDYMNPLKLFEYHAAGLPVVAPEIPAVIEFIDDNTHALLTDGTVSDIETKIERLYKNVGLRERLAKQGRHHIVSQFTWKKHTNKILGDLQEKI